jgi:hypothetical protein
MNQALGCQSNLSIAIADVQSVFSCVIVDDVFNKVLIVFLVKQNVPIGSVIRFVPAIKSSVMWIFCQPMGTVRYQLQFPQNQNILRQTRLVSAH